MVIILIIKPTNDYELMESFFMKKKIWLDLEKKGYNEKQDFWPESPLKVHLHNTIYRRNLSAASFVQTRICRVHLCI